MKTRPEVVVSCDISLGQRFSNVEVDADYIATFLSRWDLPDSGKPLTICIKDEHEAGSSAKNPFSVTMGQYKADDEVIVLYASNLSSDGYTADGTILHEIGHYIDHKLSPEDFDNDIKERVTLLSPRINKINKNVKNAVNFMIAGFACAVADIQVDEPEALDTSLDFSVLGFMASSLGLIFNAYRKAKNLRDMSFLYYITSRNEHVANSFQVDHSLENMGKMIYLENKLPSQNSNNV